MIKKEPQWFQLTTGNHRDDQTNRSPDRSRFPVFKTRPSSTSYASHSPTPFWTNKLTVSQFQLRSDESVWVLQHQRDPLIVSRPFVPSPWWGESTRGISATKNRQKASCRSSASGTWSPRSKRTERRTGTVLRVQQQDTSSQWRHRAFWVLASNNSRQAPDCSTRLATGIN